MELRETKCPACNGEVYVPPDTERVTCAYCGNELAVNYIAGDMDVSLAKELGEKFEDVGGETQETIRKGTDVTRAELQKLQIGQQITTLQLQRSTVRGEIRALQREKKLSRQAKRHLKDLHHEEDELLAQLRILQAALAGEKSDANVTAMSKPRAAKSSSSGRFPRPVTGCLWGCLTYILVGVACGFIAIPIDAALFESSLGEGASGPFFSIAAFVGFFIGIVVFFNYMFPEATIWQKMPFRMPFSKKRVDAAQAQEGV